MWSVCARRPHGHVLGQLVACALTHSECQLPEGIPRNPFCSVVRAGRQLPHLAPGTCCSRCSWHTSLPLHQRCQPVNFAPQGIFGNVWWQFQGSQLEGATWHLETRNPGLETKENHPQQGITLAEGSIVLRCRNPPLRSERESHTAGLQNAQIETPRMFKAGRPSWAW